MFFSSLVGAKKYSKFAHFRCWTGYKQCTVNSTQNSGYFTNQQWIRINTLHMKLKYHFLHKKPLHQVDQNQDGLIMNKYQLLWNQIRKKL